VLPYITREQGLGTCLDCKNKHYAELRALIGQRNIIALNSIEMLAMSVANGVKFPFSIASPVSCSEFSTMGVVVQHGYQFALYKNGSKYVSATIYNTGTMLVQGLGTCLDWKNKHYAELRVLIGQRNIIGFRSSFPSSPKPVNCVCTIISSSLLILFIFFIFFNFECLQFIIISESDNDPLKDSSETL
jgi:hypothetical protein